jgi:hypothetical protein
MCRRTGNIRRHNVQEIKVHEGEIEHVQETMWRRSRNIKGRVNLCKRQCAGEREHEGEIGHVQETMFRRTCKVQER